MKLGSLLVVLTVASALGWSLLRQPGKPTELPVSRSEVAVSETDLAIGPELVVPLPFSRPTDGIPTTPSPVVPTGDASGATASAVIGRVVDPRGEGVGRATVRLLRSTEPRVDVTSDADADGRFRIPVAEVSAEPVQILVTAGFHYQAEPLVTDPRWEITVPMKYGGRITGRLLRPPGFHAMPVSLAVIPCDADRSISAATRTHQPTGIHLISPDSKGGFQSPPIAPGPARLEVRLAATADPILIVDPILVRAGEWTPVAPDPLDLCAITEVRRVRVTDLAGSPIPSAAVALFEPGEPGHVRVSYTSEDGTTTYVCSPGPIDVLVRPRDGRIERRSGVIGDLDICIQPAIPIFVEVRRSQQWQGSPHLMISAAVLTSDRPLVPIFGAEEVEVRPDTFAVPLVLREAGPHRLQLALASKALSWG